MLEQRRSIAHAGGQQADKFVYVGCSTAHSARGGSVESYHVVIALSCLVLYNSDGPLGVQADKHGSEGTYFFAPGYRYKESGVATARSARVGPVTCIGAGTAIGERSSVASSVVGRSCNIGADCVIENSVLMANVVVRDGAPSLYLGVLAFLVFFAMLHSALVRTARLKIRCSCATVRPALLVLGAVSNTS